MSTAKRWIVLAVAIAFALFAPALYADFAYVSDLNSNQIFAYRINSGTRALTPVGAFTTPDKPDMLAAHPNGSLLYVGNRRNSIIWIYRIDPQTGGLQQLEVYPVQTNLQSLAIDPAGRFLYTGSADLSRRPPATTSVYQIDAQTGHPGLVWSMSGPDAPDQMVFDPANRFVFMYTSSDDLFMSYQIAPGQNPMLRPVDSLFIYNAQSLAVNYTGRFLCIAGDQFIGLYGIDQVSGKSTPSGPRIIQEGSYHDAMAAHPNLDLFYIFRDAFLPGAPVYEILPARIDQAGTLVIGTALPVAARLNALAVHPSGRFGFVVYRQLGVATFGIGPNGDLSAIAAPLAAGADPWRIALAVPRGPTISDAAANPATLWPPNHKMVNVAVQYRATAPCGIPLCRLSVRSSDTSAGPNDWSVLGPNVVALRAERPGTQDRVYTITISCDACGGSASKSLDVMVPHDQGK